MATYTQILYHLVYSTKNREKTLLVDNGIDFNEKYLFWKIIVNVAKQVEWLVGVVFIIQSLVLKGFIIETRRISFHLYAVSYCINAV